MRFLGEHTNKDFYTVTNHLGLNKDAHIDVANVVKRIWHYSLRQCAQWTYNGNTLLRGEQGLHLDKEILCIVSRKLSDTAEWGKGNMARGSGALSSGERKTEWSEDCGP